MCEFFTVKQLYTNTNIKTHIFMQINYLYFFYLTLNMMDCSETIECLKFQIGYSYHKIYT